MIHLKHVKSCHYIAENTPMASHLTHTKSPSHFSPLLPHLPPTLPLVGTTPAKLPLLSLKHTRHIFKGYMHMNYSILKR